MVGLEATILTLSDPLSTLYILCRFIDQTPTLNDNVGSLKLYLC